MKHIPVIDPRIIGPPPEKHASRVVGDMTRWLVVERHRLWVDIISAIRRSRGYFGSPKSQQRLAARMKKAGGKAIIDIYCKTGKRGVFTIYIVDWVIYDHIKGKMIWQNDETMIERPWLACSLTKMPIGQKDEELDRGVILFALTHHAMQRLAERCGARTPFDLLNTIHRIYPIMTTQIAKKEKLDSYVPIDGGTAVIEWSQERGTYIIVTILAPGMKI